VPPSEWPFLDTPGVLAFAHRGAHGPDAGGLPENTMAAYEAAVRMGYRYVETDVHRTADGVLVAFHDDGLDRVTDRTGKIADLPWSEVREARLVGGHGVPLFEDLLGAWPELRVNVEPKADASVALLADVIERTGSLDRVCVGSFSGRRLTRLRERLGPRLCTSMGPLATVQLRIASLGVPVGSINAACAQVPVRRGPVPVVDRRFVGAAHRRGLQVHVWTIDHRAEMERLLDLGVDGLMTDRPAVLKDVLTTRGLWA
jgi:glycerophosphoryl diester phosphodiesterase